MDKNQTTPLYNKFEMAAILSKNTAKKVKRAAEAATTTIAKSPSKTMRVAKRQMRAKATAAIPHKVEKTRKDSRFKLSCPTAAVASTLLSLLNASEIVY